MEIQDIKQRLSLATVLQHYGLQPDKNQRLHCPFHADKTPSLQVYYNTHTCYCFSSNCKTHGKSLDVIDFIMHKENINKHEALKKCEELIISLQTSPLNPPKGGFQAISVIDTANQEKIIFLEKMFNYFKKAVYNSPPAKNYIQSRGLQIIPPSGEQEGGWIGYNSGQFHHGERKDETLIAQCLAYGLLLDKNLTSKTGEKAYSVFGKNCIVFPLRNKDNQIVSLYFRSIQAPSNSPDGGEPNIGKHFYLKDRQGLYPGYPDKSTKILILTEAIIDTATLLQVLPFGKDLGWACLACFGTNGLTDEHLQAIKALKALDEIIFAFDTDEAGKEATIKYANQLHQLNNKLKISALELPCKDVNETYQAHEPEIFTHLLEQRRSPLPPEGGTKPNTDFLFSTESIENKKLEITEIVANKGQTQSPPSGDLGGLSHNLVFFSEIAHYSAKGLLKNPQDSLKIALQIKHLQSHRDYRAKLDLYEYKQLQQIAKTAAESLQLNQTEIENDLMTFTKLLEDYKENHAESRSEKPKITIPEATIMQCINFLKQSDLLDKLNEKIGQSGIVGEESNRLFLFLIATSYKMPFTLHALIQGSSGSGKTRLMQTISKLMPSEDTKHFTRVTDNSFYNYGEYDLENKLLCFEDIDGLKEEALLALRELQSNDILISSTSLKDENGKINSGERTVRGPIASLSATTKGDYYEDNISRSFVIAVDESPEQTNRIIDYQNKKAAGEIDTHNEHQIRDFIQNCVRLLKPLEVVNPYANKIQLPRQAHKIRRLNEMYQSIVKQIVILHQYQRRQDKQNRLIAQKEDLQKACEVMFESIVLKVDELEGNLRQFFEKLKQHTQNKGKDYELDRFEIMQATGLRKTQQQLYINQLVELEYLQQYGFANRGYRYKIVRHDNFEILRNQIKNNMISQLEELEIK